MHPYFSDKRDSETCVCKKEDHVLKNTNRLKSVQNTT